MHIADSLCYTAETNTTLCSNYIPIKMLKKIKNKNFKNLKKNNPPANAGDTGSIPGLGRSNMAWSN